MATKVCGIYMVINNFTGEQYIGQSTNVLKRFSNHQYESKHPKRRFHKDIQKYGINNFALIVLKESLPEELDELEKYYINFFHPEYNIAKGGKGSTGVYKTSEERETLRRAALKQWANCSEEQIKEKTKKYSETMRIKKANGYVQTNEGHKKTIICTTTGEKFESVKSAGEAYGINPTQISSVLKGRYKNTHGKHFIYEGR